MFSAASAASVESSGVIAVASRHRYQALSG